jgi:para-nitrobenzyl esterase
MKMTTPLLTALLALTTTIAGTPALAAPASGVARTDGGLVRGAVGDTAATFSGIPYAAPPTGPLRWRPPQPAAAWAGTRDATRPGDVCAQNQPFNPMSPRSDREDCLTLNVTTPKNAGGRKVPVLVWLHGGSLTFGAGSLYGAERLASQGDVVVVTVNYRLGVLGYLAEKHLGENSGNFGFQDQQAALHWVQRNAATFGGDAGNVTIAGESAGGASICTQLVAPSSRGLFHRAIVGSFPCFAASSATAAVAPRSRAAATRQGAQFADQLQCTGEPDVAACLRNVPVAALLAAGDHGQGPVYGGSFLPEDPAKALANGHFAHVPLLYGSNHDEESFMVAGMEVLAGQPVSHADYVQQTDQLFGRLGAQIRAEYPCAEEACASATVSRLRTDALWSAPTFEAVKTLARQVPTYAYEFADPTAPYFKGFPRPAVLRAGHTTELAYLFEIGYIDALTAPQKPLSAQLIGYWSRFARTGDPNGAGEPGWPRFRPGDQYVQSLAPGAIGRTGFARDHHYAFWSCLNR